MRDKTGLRFTKDGKKGIRKERNKKVQGSNIGPYSRFSGVAASLFLIK